jgi:uncharacterized membrane protein
MFRFAFVTLWTGLALAMTLAVQDEADAFQRAFLILFTGFGAVFMVVTWRQWRRRRSLRTEVEGGVTVYVWIDLDGRERRSTDDPRPDWDAADGDGDGDGGGD